MSPQYSNTIVKLNDQNFLTAVLSRVACLVHIWRTGIDKVCQMSQVREGNKVKAKSKT